jgi:5-formyltetrahydrofolate cyclo-ligase
MTDIDTAKQHLRAELKARRAALPAARRREEDAAVFTALTALAPLRRARRVFCFISRGDEVDTHALIDELLRRGKQVVVPKILPGRGMIAVALTAWSELQPGQLGILEPPGEQDAGDAVDVCITPGLAFTVDGRRLGYGRGYYDRWFTRHPVAYRIAIAYDCQVVDDLPTDERDVRVTMLITGRRQLSIEG